MGASACPARMGGCGAYSLSLELHFAKVLDAAHGLCRFRVSWRHSRTPSFALCRAERATAARYPTSCSHLCRSPAALAYVESWRDGGLDGSVRGFFNTLVRLYHDKHDGQRKR